MPQPEPIAKRIRRALEANGGAMRYHDPMDAVFPEKEYPRAWRRSVNGGPPGCAMALGAALRRGRFARSGAGPRRMVGLPRGSR